MFKRLKHTCICWGLPAVILETVQQASLRTLSRGELKRCNRQCNAEQFNTTCVCTSSPVTMFPTARRAALVTLFCSCLKNFQLLYNPHIINLMHNKYKHT